MTCTCLAKLDQSIRYDLPLPKRIWASWDEMPQTMQPDTKLCFKSPIFNVTEGDMLALYLTASGNVRVFIDGEEILPAPAFGPFLWTARRYDLSKFINAGNRQITFEASAQNCTPYILACLDVEKASSETMAGTTAVKRIMVTDETFEVSVDCCSTWTKAWAFEGVWAEPTGFPLGAPDDWARLTHGKQKITHHRFKTITEQAQGTGQWRELNLCGDLVATAHPMLMNLPPLPWHTFNPIMYHLLREDYCRRFNEWHEEQTGRASWVVLDAGTELFGRIILRNNGTAPLQVSIYTGESVKELHHYNRVMSGMWTLQPGERVTSHLIGFRYIKLFAMAASDGTFRLAQPIIQALEPEAPMTGSFACSDPLLEKIWNAGADTVRLCTQTQIWDGAKRDLLPWMGDLHIESLVWMLTTGDNHMSALSLKSNRDTGPCLSRPYRDRHVPSLSVAWGGPDMDVNGTPSYTAWWVVGLCDYALYTGDKTYPKSEVKDLIPVLERLARGVMDDGSWDWAASKLPHSFVDHSVLTQEIEGFAMQSIVSAAFQGAGKMLNWLGEDGSKWIALGEKMADNHAKQLVARQPGSLNRQSASAAGALGIGDAKSVFPHVQVCDDNLRTPWWRGYELGAAANADQIDWMLAEIRNFWGSMLDFGQTSLWECHDPKWFEKAEDPHRCAVTRENGAYGGHRISQCHGWAAGPTYWLTTSVLGIKPIDYGYAKVSFKPNLGDLNWAEGTIPTPHGPIHVRLDRQADGSIKSDIKAPSGIEIVR